MASLIFPSMCFLTMLGGILGFRYFDFAFGMPFELGDQLTDREFKVADQILTLAALTWMTSHVLFTRKEKRSSFSNGIAHPVTTFISQSSNESKTAVRASISMCLMALFLISISYGFKALLFRPEYLPAVITQLKSLGILLYLLGFSALLIYCNSHIVRLFFMLLFWLLFFSLASRLMVTAICLYYAIEFLRTSKAKNFIFLLIGVFFSSVFALQNRRAESHGLIPYIQNLTSNGIDFEIGLYAVNYLTAYSYSLIAYLGADLQIDPKIFWLSVSPLPGDLINWGRYFQDLRVNIYMPYSSFSELRSHGWGYFFGYMLCAFALFRISELILAKCGDKFPLIVLPFHLAFSYSMFQYNLRQSSRYVYYLLLISIIVFVGVRVFKNPRRSSYA